LGDIFTPAPNPIYTYPKETIMQTIIKFLQENSPFYIATIDGSQPRVRPFGAVCAINNKMYICCNNKKEVFKQMKANPKIEISATAKDGSWLRLTAEAVQDDNQAARQSMLDAAPDLKNMYKADDGLFEVFYLKNAAGVISSFDGKNEKHTF
jgi:uncharacterized pyridoxamine 5'-phosphate oxidase family protein